MAGWDSATIAADSSELCRRKFMPASLLSTSLSQQGRKYGSPFTKERFLAFEISGGGCSTPGKRGECHPGAMLLWAFDSDAGG